MIGPILADNNSTSSTTHVKQFLSSRVEGPTSVALPDQYFATKSSIATTITTADKMKSATKTGQQLFTPPGGAVTGFDVTPKPVDGPTITMNSSTSAVDSLSTHADSMTSVEAIATSDKSDVVAALPQNSSRVDGVVSGANSSNSARLNTMVSERLLWNLLQTLVDTRGSVRIYVLLLPIIFSYSCLLRYAHKAEAPTLLSKELFACYWVLIAQMLQHQEL